VPAHRLLSLDAFRGATVAGMLLVNNPGTWAASHPPLAHAEWHGWTPTDLVFPFFLFIVGVTTHLSLSARRARGDDDATLARQVLRRGATIVAIGLALNAFPFFQWGDLPGLSDASFADRILWRASHLRFLGVLQRIGLAYVIAGLLTLRGSLTAHVGIAVALLYGYWAAMTLLPVPGQHAVGATLLDRPEATLGAWLDRAVIGPAHLYAGTKTYDPEGLLSTLPASATVLLGIFAGRWLGTDRPLDERLLGLFGAGALAAAFGQAWGWSFPVNKNLWTSSYVLLTGGLAALALATTAWCTDRLGMTRWTRPFVIFGTNPIVAFVGSGLMARLVYSILTVETEDGRLALQAWTYRTAFASWLPPRDASLAFALSFVALWLLLLTPLHRRGWFLKV
jgi:predicted acyltransferase